MADVPRAADESTAVHTIMGIPLAKPGSTFTLPPRRRPRKLEGTELLARYEVESVIGEGGMATVYRGRHKAIHKAVAIKVLDAALDNIPDAVERFLQEAQVTSRVVHENVVEVNDFGITADGVVFCVMELLLGETLSDLVVATGALPVPRAAAIIRQVCSAVQAAHDRGIIHRDLKPANCFRTPRTSNPDFIKLLDFGIARVADDTLPESVQRARPQRTQMGCIMGTPDYMAPEQARAEKCDHRVDVYAAGGMLFELLTGRPPYIRGSAVELLAAHLHATVPDPSDVVPTLPRAICDVVCKAMAKDRDERHGSMAELAQDVSDALLIAGNAVTYRARRRRMTVLVSAGAGALLLGGWALRDAPTSAPATTALTSIADVAAPPLASPTEVPVATPSPIPVPRSAGVPPAPLFRVAAIVAPSPTPPRSEAPPKRRGRKVEESKAAADAEASPTVVEPVEPALIRAKISEVKNPFAEPPAP